MLFAPLIVRSPEWGVGADCVRQLGIDLRLASNLKSLCRLHHLIKTFWGWRDQQLPDGTLIWTSPSGQTYITTPGSALLFPALCVPTATLDPVPQRARCTDRTAMMPKRRRTSAQNRANYIAAERRHNQAARQAKQHAAPGGPAPPGDDDPPPSNRPPAERGNLILTA